MFSFRLNKHSLLSLIIVLVCLTRPGTNYAQSSLYKDALALAKSDMDSVYLTFSCSCSDAVRMQVTDSSSNDVKVTILDPHLSTIVRTNKQGVDYYNLSSQDAIHVSLGDSTVTLYSPRLAIDSVSFEPSDYLLEGVSISLKKMDGSAFETIKFGKGVKDIVADRAFRMASHSEFNKVNKSFVFSYPELRSAFSNNPYLRWSDYFKEGDESLFLDTHNSPFYLGSSFTDGLYRAYPYLKIIHGDSVLSLQNNVSLAAVDQGYRQQIITAQTQLESASGQFSQQRRKGGLLDVNTIAVGLSDFITEQAQEELNLTFFNRFKKNLEKDTELTRLFPATKGLLYKFDISNYKTFLAHARETFSSDLDNLGTNLPKVLKLEKYKSLRDNPDIFNLALIYNIADLAYQEYPVETILLEAHRELRERQNNLNRSIELIIADSLSKAGMVTAPGGNSSLKAYRDSLLSYLDTIRHTSYNFRDRRESLIKIMVQDLKRLAALSPLSPDTSSYFFFYNFLGNPHQFFPDGDKLKIIELKDDLYREERYLKALNSPDDFEYEDRVSGNTSYVRFSKASIDNSLQGREYYGWITEQGKPNDFERYFRNKPLPAFKHVARGLKYSRHLLTEDFGEGLASYRTFIEKKISSVEGIRRIRIEEENLRSTFTSPYEREIFLLWKGIQAEVTFWQYVSGLDPSVNRELAGLNFLKNWVINLRRSNVFDYQVDGRRTQVEYIKEVNAILDDLDHKVKSQIQELKHELGDRVSVCNSSEYTDFLNALQYNDFEYLQKPTNPSHTTISELFSEGPNRFLKEFQDLRKSVNNNSNTELVVIEEIRQQLEKDQKTVNYINQFQENLKQQLAKLENTYTPGLVKARDNARSLTTAVELATHLLFAFRNYDRVYDTLYYLDTQTVEVTVQQINPATGNNRTFKKDSTIIVKTVVPGTEKAVTNARWLTREEFIELRQNEHAWNAFLGLLYQRLRSVKGAPEFSPEGIALLATQFLKTANEMEEHSNELRRKHARDPKSVTFRDHYPTIRSTVDLFNTIITAPAVGDDAVTYRSKVPDLELIPTISNEALSLYENIYVRNYGSAILNATELLKIITKRELTKEQLSKVNKKERKKRTRTLRNVNAIFRYGTFMAEMINAKSSDQVKNILKSTTLPPGSSRIKREVTSSFTINSYLGIAAGQDRLLDAPTEIIPSAFGAAASVPIGLTYSFSPWFIKNNSSFSFHVPLIDIGAVFAYRFNPDNRTVNINNLPELEWKNLLSPGIYLQYNLANSPWSLGLGMQYGPQLREINQANGEPVFLNSLRLPIGSVSFDLPFYSLHTGPKKIKVR